MRARGAGAKEGVGEESKLSHIGLHAVDRSAIQRLADGLGLRGEVGVNGRSTTRTVAFDVAGTSCRNRRDGQHRWHGLLADKCIAGRIKLKETVAEGKELQLAGKSAVFLDDPELSLHGAAGVVG